MRYVVRYVTIPHLLFLGNPCVPLDPPCPRDAVSIPLNRVKTDRMVNAAEHRVAQPNMFKCRASPRPGIAA